MISYEFVVKDNITIIYKEYVSNNLLIVITRKVYKYLGMTLHFQIKDSVAFTKYDYIKKFCTILPNELYKELIQGCFEFT